MIDLDTTLPLDVAGCLESFVQFESVLLHTFLQKLESEPPPALVYHYTDEGGLRGIVGDGKIWMTDAFQLNDTSELSHGIKILNERLAARIVSSQPEVRVFAEAMRQFSSGGGIAASAHFFVGSFSTLGDDLTQWTRYADDGRGYVLAFDASELERTFAQPSNGTWNTMTFPVDYEDAHMIELVEPLLDLVIPLISLPRERPMSRAERSVYLRNLEIHFSLAALHRNVFFKHGAYKSESEYRFLEIHRADVPPPDVKTRHRHGQCVRYREMEWRRAAPKALRSVTVGPAAPNRQSALNAARDALEAAQVSGVELRSSDLPYRSFRRT